MSQFDEVAVIDLATAAVVQRVTVGRRPRALALTPNGATLAVANLTGGSVSVVATTSLKEEARVKLRGVNVRGIAVTASGEEAYTTVMPALNARATDDPKEVWHNAGSRRSAWTAPTARRLKTSGRILHRSSEAWTWWAARTSMAIVLDRSGTHAWVAVAGRDVLDPHHRPRQPAERRLAHVAAPDRGGRKPPRSRPYPGRDPGVGRQPPGKQRLHRGRPHRGATRYDPARLPVPRRSDGSRAIPVQQRRNDPGAPVHLRLVSPGRGTDGLTWTFVHVRDGVARRTPATCAPACMTRRPSASGAGADLPAFMDEELTGLRAARSPTTPQAEALAAAVEHFQLLPNPYVPDGSLTAAAERGHALFDGKGGCGGCHAGPKRGGTGRKAWVGSTSEGQPLDVPHLTGAYDSAPYLHDGRAATLAEIFTRYNPDHRHGGAHELSPAQLMDLLDNLREL